MLGTLTLVGSKREGSEPSFETECSVSPTKSIIESGFVSPSISCNSSLDFSSVVSFEATCFGRMDSPRAPFFATRGSASLDFLAGPMDQIKQACSPEFINGGEGNECPSKGATEESSTFVRLGSLCNESLSVLLDTRFGKEDSRTIGSFI